MEPEKSSCMKILPYMYVCMWPAAIVLNYSIKNIRNDIQHTIHTFGHFNDVSWMGVPFVMSLTTSVARRTIWLLSVSLRLSALGTECEILWFLLVESSLLTLSRAFNLEDLLPGCYGDRGSCELVLRRTSLAGLSEAFQSNF